MYPGASETIEEASQHIRRANTGGPLSPATLLAVVLMWLIALGAPIAEVALPSSGEVIASNGATTVGLALAITWRAVDKRKET
jgi:hypothetical protein